MKKTAPIKLLAHFFTVVILMTCLSCEDDNIFKQLVDPPAKVLPPATQTGANTFGCKVNGKVWLPSETAWIEFINGGLNIVGEDILDNNSAVAIHIGEFTISDSGYFQLGKHTSYFSQASFDTDKNIFITDLVNIGNITITRLDTTKLNYIVSGTFNFKARDEITGETVEITEGRFDLRKY